MYTRGLLRGIDWSNMIVAGGAVLSCVLPDCIVTQSLPPLPTVAPAKTAVTANKAATDKSDEPVSWSSVPSAKRDAAMAINQMAVIAATPPLPLSSTTSTTPSVASIASFTPAPITTSSEFISVTTTTTPTSTTGSSHSSSGSVSVSHDTTTTRKRVRDDNDNDDNIKDEKSSADVVMAPESIISKPKSDEKNVNGSASPSVATATTEYVVGANGFHTSDIDIFIVGLTPAQATAKMITILSTIQRNTGSHGDILVSPCMFNAPLRFASLHFTRDYDAQLSSLTPLMALTSICIDDNKK
jgi:hypothetical protein